MFQLSSRFFSHETLHILFPFSLEAVVDPWMEKLFPALRNHLGLADSDKELVEKTDKQEVKSTTETSTKDKTNMERINKEHIPLEGSLYTSTGTLSNAGIYIIN